MFYIDSDFFMRALMRTQETETALREKAGICTDAWYRCKRGDQPVLRRTVARLASLLGVEPEALICRDAAGYAIKAVVSA